MSFDSSYGEPVSITAKYVNGATTTPLFVESYTRDALGRIATKTNTVGTTTNQFAYTYDTSGRLTDVAKNAVAYSHYNFSSNNNLTSGNVGGAAFSATYDAQDRILTYNTNTYSHTLNGEMKSKTVGGVTTNYTYNGFGLLKTAKVGSGAVITYLYDGLNRRIGRKSGSTVQKYWVYQDQLRIGAELNSSGAITKKFIYGTKINVPDYMIIGSTTYKIVSDHLGSVRMVVNAANGTISQTIEYNERGDVLSDSSPGFQPFGFAGGLYESDLKLVHFGARSYDSSIGRWISKDPIGFKGGDTNQYGYVVNDPINLTDPSGLFIPWLAGGLLGALTSGMSACLAGGDMTAVWTAAGIGFVAGAATVGLSALAGGSASAMIAAGASIGVVGNGATQFATGANSSNFNYGAMALAGIAGGIGGAAGLGAGNTAFFNTAVIGNPVGVSAAASNAMWSSALVGAGVGFGVENSPLLAP